MTGLPEHERVPIISHWGVTGGELFAMAGPTLQQIDFSVVQTYSFIGDERPRAREVAAAAVRLSRVRGTREIASPVGVAHAYDLTQLLARAIDRAGSTDRAAIRSALEKLGPYQGLIKNYPAPFTPSRHEALSPAEVFMARFAADGAIVRIPAPRQ
jgi:branched-chain amino acid transport system substrate-binding protein